jgi:PAS domain S-box-containing protein
MTSDAGPSQSQERLAGLLEDDPADLYENAPCGYLSTLPDGTVVKVNRTFCAWIGRPAGEVLGARFQDLLAVGGRVFNETHLAPLLRMQGAVREIALDVLRADGSVLPCLLNAVELRDAEGAPLLVRATLFDATARRRYERDLLATQRSAQESEARARTLHRMVSGLAEAISVRDVAAVIVERSRAALRAAGAALVLVEEPLGETPARPRLELSDGLPEAVFDELRAAAGERLPLELAEGLRLLPVDERMARLRPALAEALAAAGMTGLVVVPVSADGRRLGAVLLTLGGTDRGLISLEEPGVRTTLAPADLDLMETLGRQAGQALERARLHEETARQAERSAFLLDAARLLAGASGVLDSVERVAELAVPRLADVCVIDLVTEQGLSRAAVRHGDPGRQAVLAALRDVHLPHRGAPEPSVRAVEERRTQWIRLVNDDALDRITRNPRQRQLTATLELRAIVSVPLLADGRPLGALTLGADRHRGPFTAADVDVAEQLALHLALVVDKAQRYETDVRTSHTLQANLLPPPPPVVPGLATAVRYLPATRGVEIGGDFYDVVRMSGGTVALAVGDVVGHDVTAAATMGQLTSVHRALLVDGPGPSAVIDRLQASWSLLGLKRMATALFATLDPPTGQLRIASAGHPPPLLIDGGAAAFLPVHPGRMLGAPPAPTPAAEWAGVLAPGATLVLFTDGLVESRTADIDAGLDRLRAAAAAASDSASPDELCDRLLAELTGRHRADDVAMLALTRLPAAP